VGPSGEFSFRKWPDDCTGITLVRVERQKSRGLFCRKKTIRRWYRYDERPVGRDEAGRFYDSPHMHMVGVQRVAVIDKLAQEIMICTPSRAAAWIVLRNRGVKNAVVSEVNSLDNISQEELDAALTELRDKRNGTITTDAANHQGVPRRMFIKEGDAQGAGSAKVWNLTGFAENGGWATFFEAVMVEGNRWLAVIAGATSSPKSHVKPTASDKFDLIFKDNEVELLYGEGRRYAAEGVEILGVQLRRGYAVVRGAAPSLTDGNQNDHAHGSKSVRNLRYDQMVLPKGLKEGLFNNSTRTPINGLIWRIRSGEAVNQYELKGDL